MRKNIFVQNIAESSRQLVSVPLKCSACGAQSQRETAKFCLICGHDLRADYAPLDLLRASYNLHKQTEKQSIAPSAVKENNSLFAEYSIAEHSNSASSVAAAFVVYSLVPYLGILFCPGSLVFGGIGLAVSFQKPQLGGRQTAIYSLLFGSIIFGIQILLWYLLYIVPELKK